MSSPCVNCGADIRMCKECDWYNGVWISKDQYETRLKADMVDMLEELDFRLSNYQDTDLIRQDIQEKITKLKENKDGSN